MPQSKPKLGLIQRYTELKPKLERELVELRQYNNIPTAKQRIDILREALSLLMDTFAGEDNDLV